MNLQAPWRWPGLAATVLPWLVMPLLFSPGSIQVSGALSRPGVPERIVSHYLLTFLPWIVFCIAVQRLTWRSLQLGPGRELGIGRHIGLWVGICAVHAVAMLIGDVLGMNQYGRPGDPWLGRVPGVLLHIAPFDGVLYLAVAGISAAWGQTRLAGERQRALAEAQLAMLKAQLQPHFLFNVMNAVSELIHANPQAADDTLGRLSRLLRKFADQREHTQPLRDELDIVEDYLGIQRTLLGGDLSSTLSVDRQALGVAVPAMLLQPLVENAVLHGARPVVLTMEVTVQGDLIEIDLRNPARAAGPWEEGVGLRNVRDRLATLYGGAASLTTATDEAGLASVRVSLPIRRE